MSKLFKSIREKDKKEVVKKNDTKLREIFDDVDEAMAYVKSTSFKRVES